MPTKDPRMKFANADFPQREQSIPGIQQALTPQPECVVHLLIN